MIPWYDRAFGSWYLRLYPHRDREEAARTIPLLDAWLPREGVLIDVGCGTGRHLEVLAERGRAVIGLDRSATLLGAVDAGGPLRGRVVRGDMRHLPFGGARFAGLLSMFTSFGYFESRDAHRHLLREFARVVRPGGRMILDYLNAPAVRRNLEGETRRELDGYVVQERRRIRPGEDADLVVKRVHVRDARGATVAEYEERVALYDREDVEAMLETSGWTVRAVFGGYDGAPWAEGSERLFLVTDRNRPA